MWMPFLPPCTWFEDSTTPCQWQNWAFDMQASTCFKEECNLNRTTLKAGSLQILNPQIKYLANCFSGVKIHDLMALAFPILIVVTSSVASFEFDAKWTSCVTDSTSLWQNLKFGSSLSRCVVSSDGWWASCVSVDTPPSTGDSAIHRTNTCYDLNKKISCHILKKHETFICT